MKTIQPVVTLYADEESVEELTYVIDHAVYGNESMTSEEQARAIIAKFRELGRIEKETQ